MVVPDLGRALMQRAPLALLTALLGCDASAAAPTVADGLTQARTADGAYIAWREHTIDTTTASGQPLTGGDGLVACDLDGDGREDLVSVHESDTRYDGVPDGHVRAAFATGDPERWDNVTLVEGPDAGAPEDAACGDVDGDGHIDVVVAAELAHLVFLRNPGARARTANWPRLVVPATRGRGSFIRVFLADFDGDGRLDASTANKGAQNPDPNTQARTSISIFRVLGDPLDGASWKEHVLGRYLIPQNAEPVDIDGDGDLDIVGGVRAEARLVLFLNQRRGALDFAESPLRIDGPVRAAGFNLAFADFDGDTRLDIVSASDQGLVWLEQPDDLALSWRAHPIGTLAPDWDTGIALADIDSDGDLDVMAGGYSRGDRDHDGDVSVDMPLGRLAWFANEGAGQRWTRHDISRRARGMFDKFVVRDVDGDGDPDFYFTRGNSRPFDGVFWLEQTRSPTPGRNFVPARVDDSVEVPLPAPAT